MPYLRNAWYVAGWVRELADQPVAITIMDEPITLYRGPGGLHALEDRCPHRHLPLSMGTPEGDVIRCGYHGMAIGCDGQCVDMPGQAAIPPRARVRSYPAVERYGWMWVWMGDADRADPALIPTAFAKLTDPNFAAVGKTNHVACHYQLLIDNLMDLSHPAFVHKTTIGAAGDLDAIASLTVSRGDKGVNVRRITPDVPTPPTYVRSGVLPAGGRIDRWQNIDYLAPAYVHIHVGGAPAGTGATEGRYEHGLNHWVMNAITPESDTSCHYFWASVRSHALADPAADALFLREVSEAFEDDKRVLQAQQQVISRRGDNWDNAVRADAGCIESRRFLDRLLAAEQPDSAKKQSGRQS